MWSLPGDLHLWTFDKNEDISLICTSIQNILLVFLLSSFTIRFAFPPHSNWGSTYVIYGGSLTCIFFVPKCHIASNCCGRGLNPIAVLSVNFLTTRATFVATKAFSRPEKFKDGLIKKGKCWWWTEWLVDVAALRYGIMWLWCESDLSFLRNCEIKL